MISAKEDESIMSIRVWMLSKLLEMDMSDIRKIAVISAIIMFAMGLFLAKNYLKETIEKTDKKVKLTTRALFGFGLQVAAVVLFTLSPEALCKLATMGW
ncbi:hypothetical protein [Ruminococcus sp.]|jgi:hypothetical protein|uniref:hypothetical protein n=1 Tax=Ruminococcus sp. TaxID=41978 RepID=UPI0025DA2DCE|nr:hypothetical protein [Ruminococcus sp.]